MYRCTCLVKVYRYRCTELVISHLKVYMYSCTRSPGKSSTSTVLPAMLLDDVGTHIVVTFIH